MRAKNIVSTAIFIGMAVMVVTAFANFEMKTFAENILKQTIETGATNTIEWPSIVCNLEEKLGTSPDELLVEQRTKRAAEIELSQEDAYFLAKIAMAEAETEDTKGKALVIMVVLNRIWNDEFPNTIKEVLYQKNQFSSVWNSRFANVEPDEDCWRALYMVWEGRWDESQNATYFCTPEADDKWHDSNLEYLFQHGNHKFYKDFYCE